MRALGPASLSPMLEGEGSNPDQDDGLSPVKMYVIPMSGRVVGGFLRVLRFASPQSGTFKIKIDSKFCNS